jgi:outer membrane protein OmpA-like peptidoglycan-associated protein
MDRRHFTQLSRIIFAASGIAMTLGGPAMAQTVQVFDEAPPIEQLRSIMIPESKPGLSRSIVIQRPDVGMQNTSVQRAAVKMVQPQAVSSQPDTQPVAQPVPMMDNAPAAKPQRHEAPAAKPATVGFHINFAFNSAVLPESAHGMIDEVAQVMKEAPDIKVRVEGHTDAVGAPDYNISLSERRALSVAEYLVKLGIEPSRLVLVGKGMTEPLTRNPYDPTNRRVQFVRVS